MRPSSSRPWTFNYHDGWMFSREVSLSWAFLGILAHLRSQVELIYPIFFCWRSWLIGRLVAKHQVPFFAMFQLDISQISKNGGWLPFQGWGCPFHTYLSWKISKSSNWPCGYLIISTWQHLPHTDKTPLASPASLFSRSLQSWLLHV